MKKKLPPMQAKFVEEYLKDLNATQAYIRAGYAARGNSAEVSASKLLRTPKVSAEVKAAQSRRSRRVEVEQDYVLRRLLEIDQMDLLEIMNDDMSLRPISEWPKVWRQYLSGCELAEIFEGAGDQRKMIGILKKIKWPDKVKNLELLGRHEGVFRDKLDLRVDVADLSDEDIQAELARLASAGVIPAADGQDKT